MFSHILKQPLSFVNFSSFGIIWVPKFKKTHSHMGPNPMYVIIHFQIRHTISNYLIFIAICIILRHCRSHLASVLATELSLVSQRHLLRRLLFFHLDLSFDAGSSCISRSWWLWSWAITALNSLNDVLQWSYRVCTWICYSSCHWIPSETIKVFQLWYVEDLQIHGLFSCKFPPIWTVNQLCSIDNPLICPLMAVHYIGM